jgi:thermolabile hemolysin
MFLHKRNDVLKRALIALFVALYPMQNGGFLFAQALFDDVTLAGRSARFWGVSGTTQATRRLIVFGDSLSDIEGRLFQYTGGIMPQAPLYWRHRLSNGPLWIEYFAQALQTSVVSYATAGARLTQYNNYGFIPPLLSHLWAPPLSQQLAALESEGVWFDSQDWIFLWIGNNDFMFEPVPQNGHYYCSETLDAVQALKDRGARRLTVIGVSDVSLTPFSRRGGSGLSITDLRDLVIEHNRCLDDRLRDFQKQNPALKIDFISLNGLTDHIISHSENYSLADLETPCLTGSTWPTITIPLPPFPPFVLDHFLGACSLQNSYFFWDAWHPNTMIHCIATLEVLKQLSAKGHVKSFAEDPVSKLCF